MTLSVAVMAHPRRKRMVDKLVAKLDAPAHVVWDERNDVWHTGRRALQAHGETDWHLVLQDDAVIPRRLHATCTDMLAHVPMEAPVSLYMGRWRHRPYRFPMESVANTAQARGASFAVFGGPWWGVGIILPTQHIEAVVAFGDKARHQNYDIRIAQFYAREGIDCWYTMPSLVEHQAGASIVGRRGRNRHAQWHDIDPRAWTNGYITPDDIDTDLPFPVTP